MKSGDKTNETTLPEREQLISELILEILETFFDLRAKGQNLNFVTEWGAGSWGLLRLLSKEGPITISEVARIRSVSRQYIQKLANHLQEDDLIELVVNEADKRSKVMRLTPKGKRKLNELTVNFHGIVNELAPNFYSSDLKITIRTISKLRKQLKL